MLIRVYRRHVSGCGTHRTFAYFGSVGDAFRKSSLTVITRLSTYFGGKLTFSRRRRVAWRATSRSKANMRPFELARVFFWSHRRSPYQERSGIKYEEQPTLFREGYRELFHVLKKRALSMATVQGAIFVLSSFSRRQRVAWRATSRSKANCDPLSLLGSFWSHRSPYQGRSGIKYEEQPTLFREGHREPFHVFKRGN